MVNRQNIARSKSAFIAVLIFVLGSASIGQAQQQVDPIVVIGVSGEKIEAAPHKERFTVLYFTGIECPLARLYAPRVAKLSEAYAKDVQFFGINSNQQDSSAEFAEFVKEFQLKFPCGKDFNNIVADQLKVKRTPEVTVLDQEFSIRYRGRIDDQYSPGIARSAPKRNDLKIAIDELLAGKSVTQSATEPEG